MTTPLPGDSDVFIYGATESPAFTAFMANIPAPILFFYKDISI